MARIITVYTTRRHKLVNMSYIRWYKISEALAGIGHEVDIATNESGGLRFWRDKSPVVIGDNLRRVPLSKVNWNEYDIVKTLYDEGFDNLTARGGSGHPFIISRLGTVVAPGDREGIYFRGNERDRIYAAQEKMSRTSRFIAVLNEQARQLWQECFGAGNNVLIVPGAADSSIPGPGENPYPKEHPVRCIFAGNLFWRSYAGEANAALVNKLNRLGESLTRRGIRLYTMGTGDIINIDARYVTHLGALPYEETWNYYYHANAGIEMVKTGKFMHNNESSKIYHYLRAGLPVVSEEGLPNNGLIEEAKLGFIVENGNPELMAEKIEVAAHTAWDREYAVRFVLDYHTWEKRAMIYHEIIGRYST